MLLPHKAYTSTFIYTTHDGETDVTDTHICVYDVLLPANAVRLITCQSIAIECRFIYYNIFYDCHDFLLFFFYIVEKVIYISISINQLQCAQAFHASFVLFFIFCLLHCIESATV